MAPQLMRETLEDEPVVSENVKKARGRIAVCVMREREQAQQAHFWLKMDLPELAAKCAHGVRRWSEQRLEIERMLREGVIT